MLEHPKERSDAVNQETDTPSLPARADLIRTVQTPLGFFVLVVLVVEGILGVTASLSEGSARTYLVVGMIAVIVLLVGIVAFMAYRRPEGLKGESTETSISLHGDWKMTMKTSKNETRKGSVTIRQRPGRKSFEVVGRVENPDAARDEITFYSVASGIRGRTIYFGYENIDRELGLAFGEVAEDRPEELFFDYHDCEGFDVNDDPRGRVYLRRV